MTLKTCNHKVYCKRLSFLEKTPSLPNSLIPQYRWPSHFRIFHAASNFLCILFCFLSPLLLILPCFPFLFYPQMFPNLAVGFWEREACDQSRGTLLCAVDL